ncbi:site-specific integrase [Lactobacillus nasalidis]|uniref:Site-specific integrase n=1 Tax=Lactobacillus nasalidis TaxID=2797258 RepID=A0ABQ3W432_9LACO|nr:tyrosine-type recombinase/integrase [Lactobacillus nasalidis]GHV98532.1 site-specific integrase [Lactobacillus nasalidis]GHV99961.1 site-specific integrase [Lactobacillus nasalidis]GHW01238.1 site-specific integrase [Lactobacillus nasalidis]
MAFIEKKDSGWRAKISWYDANGKRHTKSKQGFETKRLAQQWANKMEVAKDKQQLSPTDPIFVEYFLEWAQTFKMSKVSDNTKKRYINIGHLIEQYFGKAKISSITQRSYQQFINSYGHDHSKSTMEKVHGTIKSCAKYAVYEGTIPRNFADQITLVWDESKTRHVEYLSRSEIKSLIASLEDNISPKYVSRYMILCAIYTGMRFGEILALEWDDIDYNNHTIRVNKSYDYIAHRTKKPKTASSNRFIRVSSKFLDLIAPLKVNGQERVFAPSDGSYISSSATNHTLRRHLAKCGLEKEGFHFHSLRHSHVALLLFSGVPLYAISKRLGHADMSVTAKKYAYLIDELRQQSDHQIEEILEDL